MNTLVAIGKIALIAFSAIISWILFSSLTIEKLFIALSLIAVGLAATFYFEENKATGSAMLYVGLGTICASLGVFFHLVL